MKTRTQEIKWAAWGFIGGFLLCYLLIGALAPQPSARSVLAKRPEATLSFRASAASFTALTNFHPPELRIELPPRWLGSPPGPVFAPTNPGYHLDLIDTHSPPPSLDLLEKP